MSNCNCEGVQQSKISGSSPTASYVQKQGLYFSRPANV